MKTKFEEWYDKVGFDLSEIGSTEKVAKKSWDACKKEVLKEINKFTLKNKVDTWDLIEKIKNL